MTEQLELLTDRLCLVLLHSIWQVAGLALFLFVVERFFFRRISVQMRYRMHVSALLVAVTLVPVTFFMLPTSPESESTHSSNSATAKPGEQVTPIEQLAEHALSSPATEFGKQQLSNSPAELEPVGAPAFTRAAPWMLGIYLAGCLGMLVRLGRSTFYARKQRLTASPLESGPVFDLVQSLASRMALRCSPVVAFCDATVVPAIVGLAKPTVLLPTSVVTGLSREQLEMVLTHELAHIRRGDMFVSMIQRLVEVFLFFNPSVWYLTRRIDALREHCCDEATCVQHAHDEAGRLRYADALLRIVELAGDPKRLNLGQLAATGAKPSELRRRIARLCGSPYSHSNSGAPLALAALALILLIPAIWTSAVYADQPSEKQVEHEFAAGGSVELVAMGKDENGEQVWWNENGKPITAPFEWQKGHSMNGRSDGWQRVVMRLSDLPEGAETTWRIVGSTQSGSAGVTVDGTANPKGYLARHFAVQDGQDSVTVRVGLAAGEWNSIGTSQGGTAYGFQDKHSLLFSRFVDTNNGVYVVVSHNYFKTNFRVVAFDKAGKVHDSAGRGGNSANGIYQTTSIFPGLTKDQIDRVEFQTRQFEWIELEDLPLNSVKN